MTSNNRGNVSEDYMADFDLASLANESMPEPVWGRLLDVLVEGLQPVGLPLETVEPQLNDGTTLYRLADLPETR